MNLAKRMKNLGTETAFEVLAKAKKLEKEGKKIIHFEIGEPDFDTPENIKEAAWKALQEGKTHYSPSQGIYELREVIAQYISQTRNIPVSPDEVVVAPGGKPIIFYTLLALADEGDEIIYPDPGYPIYSSVAAFTGAKPVPLPLRIENEFKIDFDELKQLITDKTKVIILNSPHNPCGSMLDIEDLEKLANILKNNPQIMVLSDEIYSRIIYDGKHYSLASLPGMKERVIILDGYSKTYAMTGWRLGYGVMPKWLVPYITKLITNSVSCASTFIQYAGIEAIKGPQSEVDKMVKKFKERRDYIVKEFQSIEGVKIIEPKGAFYVFPYIGNIVKDIKGFCDHLLYEYGVAVLPGSCFGKYCEGFIRISYAASMEDIKEGMKKIKEALYSHSK